MISYPSRIALLFCIGGTAYANIQPTFIDLFNKCNYVKAHEVLLQQKAMGQGTGLSEKQTILVIESARDALKASQKKLDALLMMKESAGETSHAQGGIGIVGGGIEHQTTTTGWKMNTAEELRWWQGWWAGWMKASGVTSTLTATGAGVCGLLLLKQSKSSQVNSIAAALPILASISGISFLCFLGFWSKYAAGKDRMEKIEILLADINALRGIQMSLAA
jgi:hypothetical protein